MFTLFRYLANMTNNTRFLFEFSVASCAFVVLVTACATSPRGRQQLLIVPDDQMNAMGAQSFAEMKQQTKISNDPRLNQYVQCVTRPLTEQIQGLAPAGGWEIVVFDEPKTVNAFALPGGKIGVYTGMLAVAETPSQLAAVIGHEIGHVIAKHGNERVSEAFATQGGLAVISTALGSKGNNRNLLLGALGLGAQFGILLPHSRAQESEADIMGLELMAKAGFNPSEAATLWRNMSKSGGAQPPEILSTHPSNQTRIANLESNVPSVMGFYQGQQNRPSCQR